MSEEAQTIDQVIQQLEDIIDDALRHHKRIGYFAALYWRVTVNVRRAIIAGNVFQDNSRMEQLDIIFANRFLHAWRQYCAGETSSQCWQVAFDALLNDKLLVMQHLLLGMNAHINLDLGIAAAEVAGSPTQMQSLKPDFMQINVLLARLVDIVQVELGQISPRLGFLARFMRMEKRVFGFGMDIARDEAWSFAESLAANQGPNDTLILSRDIEMAELGNYLSTLGIFSSRAAKWIWQKESQDICHNIQIVGE